MESNGAYKGPYKMSNCCVGFCNGGSTMYTITNPFPS